MGKKKINLLKDHTEYLVSFSVCTIVFLGALILFGFNAKNFHRHGNTMLTPEQKKSSKLAITGLLLLVLSLVTFGLTLILFYHSKPKLPVSLNPIQVPLKN